MNINRLQKNKFSKLAFSVLVFFVLVFGVFLQTHAAFNPAINYQGKLTDGSAVAVPDGTYEMEFSLYTQASGGSPVWTETLDGADEVEVTSGLFSVMLGSTSPLTSVDFNQTLYLGVSIEADAEMSPRKILGAVPAAFEAEHAQDADTVGGVASTSFLRSDQADTASGLLTFTGGLISQSSSTIANLTALTATTTNLVINNERFTDLTGTGLSNNSGVLTLNTTLLDTWYASSTDFDTSAELLAILTDETGTGNAVFSASPTFTGTVNASALTLSSTLTFSGSSGQIVKSGSAAGQLDIDFPNATSTSQNLRLFRNTNTTGGRFFTIYKGDGSSTAVLQVTATSGALTINGQSNDDNLLRLRGISAAGERATMLFQNHDGTQTYGSISAHDENDPAHAPTNHISIETPMGDLSTTITRLSILWGVDQSEVQISNADLLLDSNEIQDIGNTTSFLSSTTWQMSGANTTNGSTLLVQNTSNGAYDAPAIIEARVGGNTTTGDPQLRLGMSGGNTWHVGVDNSNSDLFVIGTSTTVGAAGTSFLTVTTAGVVNVAKNAGSLMLGDGTNTSTHMNVAGGRTLFGYNGANAVVQGGTGKGILFNVNNGSFGSGNAAILTSGGNFGIGTTTPANKLTVVGDARITGALYDNSNNAGSNGMVLQSTGTGFNWVATSTLGISTNPFGASINVTELASEDFGSFSCNGTTCTVDSNALSASMIANGDHGFFSYSSNAASLDANGLTSANLISAVSDETGTNRLVFSNAPAFSGTATFSALTATSTLTLSGTAANIALGSNYLSGDGGDEGIFVDGSGNVGIGTSTPNEKLTVADGIRVFDASSPYDTLVHLYDSSDDGVIDVYQDTAVWARIHGNGDSFILGELGIGTTSPEGKLAIDSSTARMTFFDSDAAIGALNPRWAFRASNSEGEFRIEKTLDNSVYTRQFAIDQSGNVRIGDSSASSTSRLSINNWTENTDILNFLQSGVDRFAIQVNTTGTDYASFFVNDNRVLTLTQTSLVGIGTTTPSQELTVSGDIQVTGRIYDSAGSAGTNGMVLQSTGTGFNWVATSTLGIVGGLTSADINTSAEIAAIVGDETGSGALVFGTSPTLTTPNLGTPSALTLTNATGLPVATGISGLGTGVATFLATPSTANFAAAVTGETGTGAVVFATSPTLVTPILGTPTSVTLTNATGLPVSTGLTGAGTGVLTALGVNVGSAGAVVVNGGALGTPSSGTLTNATGLPVATGISGLGTGVATWLATPSSANLISAVTDETGTGALVFGTSPTFTTQITTPLIQIDTNTTGISLDTDGDGMLIIAGTANGSDEDIRINLDDTANSAVFTSATGVTIANFSGIALQESGINVLNNDEIDASSELLAIMDDETGTGRLVFSNAPAFSGTATFSALTATSTLSLSGTAANIALGSNFLSGDGGDEGIRIDSNGNVAIATSTESGVALNVGGMIYSTDGLFVDNGDADLQDSLAVVNHNSFGITDDSLDQALLLSGGYYYGYQASSSMLMSSGDFHILTFEGGVPTPRLTVAEGGNIGIGTTSPNYELHLNAPGNTDIQLTVEGDGSTNVDGLILGIDNVSAYLQNLEDTELLITTANAPMTFYTNGNERMRISEDGTIGIGTTTPSQELSVVGDVQISGRIYGNNNSAGTNGMVLQSTGTGFNWVATSSLGITGGGGLTSADIDTSAELAAIVTNETGTNRLVFSNAPAFSGTATFSALTATSTVTFSGYTGQRALFLDNTGNLITAGAASVYLSSTISDETGSGRLVFANAPTFFGTATFSALTATSTLTLSGTAANIALGSNYLSGDGGDEGIFVSGTGNVGVGTSSPTYKFQIEAGNSENIALGSVGLIANSVWTTNLGFISELGEARITSRSTTPMVFYTGGTANSMGEGTERLRITNTGNIGIGTSTPTQELSVVGDLQLSGRIYDSSNSAGTNGMVLQSTGTGFNWVATSSLGIVGGLTSADINTSAEIAAIVGDETGSGALVFGTSPTFTTPILGAASATSLTLTNDLTVANGGTGVSTFGGINTILYTTAADTLSSEAAFIYNPSTNTFSADNVVANTAASPDADGGADLGSGTLAWDNLFLDTAATINFDNGNSVITHSSGILTVSTGDLRVTTAGTNSASVVTVGGTQTLTAKTLTSPIINTATVGTSLLPTSDGGADLGSGTVAWDDLFLDTGATINFDNGNSVITHSSGILTVSTGDLRVTTAGTNAASVVTVGGTQTLTSKTLTSPSISAATLSGITTFSGLTASRGLFLDSSSRATTTAISGHLLNSITDETGSGVLVFNGSPTFTTQITTPLIQLDTTTTGVTLDTDGDGMLIIAGTGNGNDEDLRINLDDSANTATFTSTTALDRINFSGITLEESGIAVLNIDEIDASSELVAILDDETGTGALVFGTSPTFTTNITTPLITGGTGASSNLLLKSTSGAGSSDYIGFLVGSNGTTEAARFTTAGRLGLGTTTPNQKLSIFANGADAAIEFSTVSGANEKWTIGVDDSDGGKFKISSSSALGTNDRFVINGAGNVGIGTTTPSSLLAMGKSSITGSVTAGIHQYFNFTNSTASAVYYGDNTYIENAPSAASTLVGKMLRIDDSTALANTVRGMEVQAHRGTNTQGENTGVSAFGRTFGLRGTTEGDAGGVFQPAGVFAQTRGTTQGNAIRAYSASITTEDLVSLFQDTSAFTGTGLVMNFGNSGGSFSSSSSKFIDFQNAGTSKFTVKAHGMTTIGDGTTSNAAGLQIGYGGLCVDNDGTCTASTTGRITSVSSSVGNSDLAEMYFSSQDLQPGDIVYTTGILSIGKASDSSKDKIIGVVSTKPGLTLGFDDTSLTSGQDGYPVALSGRVPIRLSTENGPIKEGDKIALSSIPGVGMKATAGGTIVGIALEDFDGDFAYSAGFIDQFGDDIAEPDTDPTSTTNDERIHDGCYFGGGSELGEEECIARNTERFAEVEFVTSDESEEMQEALLDLAGEDAEEMETSNGEEVVVGQALMFVNLGWHQTVEEQTVLTELTSTSTDLVLDGDGEETLWSRIKTLAQGFVDGVLTVFELKADNVYVQDELCVDGVCVTADDLRALLESVDRPTGGSGDGEPNDPPPTEPEPEEGETQEGGGTEELPSDPLAEEEPPETTEDPVPEEVIEEIVEELPQVEEEPVPEVEVASEQPDEEPQVETQPESEPTA